MDLDLEPECGFDGCEGDVRICESGMEIEDVEESEDYETDMWSVSLSVFLQC